MALLKLQVAAGPHDRRVCPVRVPVDLSVGNVVSVTDTVSGQIVPGQCAGQEGATYLTWVVPSLDAGQTRVYEVSEDAVGSGGIRIVSTASDRIDVYTGETLFTSYRYGADLARPFCYPVNDTAGAGVTRGAAGENPGETTDHVHHRSLWTAYGEVNDTDNWSEDRDYGRTVHRGFDVLENGPVVGRLIARGDWISRHGTTLLSEVRSFRFYDTRDNKIRLFDLSIDLQAVTDVHFGDTKEGGFMALRVATSMDGSRGGKIENSYGGIGEAECWGRRACWLDYSGPVEGHWAGVAVMEHPDTFRSPTYWHIRDYGLLGTNPFGGATFTGNPANTGAYTLHAGESLRFLYRLAVHLGDAQEAGIAGLYHGYVNPPKVTTVE
ncbi:MAG: PmoA family protein [candidate division Zixibacteria bacterium]|nr:PmoA family protein [candidate division Zixibacteria bacterium]